VQRLELEPLPAWDQFCYYTGVVPAQTCDRIIGVARSQPTETAHIAATEGAQPLDRVRRSRVRWLPPGDDTNFIYELVVEVMLMANAARWRFDVAGFSKPIQFTEYDEVGSHYDWHIDIGPGEYSTRKLSCTVQLSDPASYDGGDFEVLRHDRIDEQRAELRKRGTVIVFPAYMAHRVTPIHRGSRCSLVAWMEGPPYR
jgi:PKHD-type hydroxylase